MSTSPCQAQPLPRADSALSGGLGSGEGAGQGARIPVLKALLSHPSRLWELPPQPRSGHRLGHEGAGSVGLRRVATPATAADFYPLPMTDTEWRSEIINSRNFDREIGHKNPR